MRSLSGVLRQVVRNGLEALVGLAILVPLQSFGLVADSPWWLFIVATIASVLLRQPAVERRLFGADPRGRMWPRVGLTLFVATVFVGAAGWAPFMPLACVVVLSDFLRVAGTDSWRPTAMQGAAATAALFLATATGWLPGVLHGGHAVMVSAMVAICAVLTGRQLIWSVYQRDLAEAAQQHSEQRFRALARVQGPTDIIAVADASGRLTYIDPAEQRLTWLAGSDKGSIRQQIRRMRFHLRSDLSFDDIAAMINVKAGPWAAYYGRFTPSEAASVLFHIDKYLVRWATRKYKHLRRAPRRAARVLAEIKKTRPGLLAHWRWELRTRITTARAG